MTTKNITTQIKVAELQLEGLKKLQEAAKIASECEACGGMPMSPVAPIETPVVEDENPKVVIKLAADEKVASLAILHDVAGSLSAQKDTELLKLATELDKVAEEIETIKTAKVIEHDADEKYVGDAFKHGVKKKEADEPYMNEFKTDTSAELAGKIKTELPYQKVRDLS